MPSLLGFGMAQEEDKHALEAKFAAAVKVIQSLPEDGPFQPSDDLMLKFYSYYKQATQGPCNLSRPTSFWNTGGKAKWDAWSSLGNMTKEEAMKNYVEDIQLILETIPITDDVSDLVQMLDTFFSEVDKDGEEENGVDKRSFTRPFDQYTNELARPFHKPTMEGYGDLWDDIQNVQENDKDGSVRSLSVSSEETEGSKGSSEVERKEESSDWKGEEEEDSIEDKDEDDEVWSPEQRLLIEEDMRWGSDTRGSSSSSSSSMERSISSLTNGTHSSLNTEKEEEELAGFMEPSVQYNSYIRINGRADHGVAIPHKNQRSTDSDNEEFCDSMDHLAIEEETSASKSLSPGSGSISVRQKELWFESNTTLNGGEDQVVMVDSHFKEGISVSRLDSPLSRRGRGSHSQGTTCSSQRCVSVPAACRCASQSSCTGSRNVKEQIAEALLRLQQDMGDVLHRLHTLETLVLTESRSSSPRQEDSLTLIKKFLRLSWWPFDFCPLRVVVYALWPLITHWFVHVYLQHKRRKIT